MPMETMFERKSDTQEVITSTEKIVSEGAEIENILTNTPDGDVKSKRAIVVGKFLSAAAGATLGAYHLSEKFQSTLNEQIQALQNINWDSQEVVRNTSLAAGGVVVAGVAVAFMKMKRAYEKSQEDNLA